MVTAERRNTSRCARHGSLRTAAAVCAGALLLGSAYQTALARPGGDTVGILAAYPDGDESGLSDAETGLAVGVGGAFVFSVLYNTGVIGGGGGAADEGPGGAMGALPAGATEGCGERLSPLPGGEAAIAARVFCAKARIESGTARCLHLEVKSAESGKWHSATGLAGTRFHAGPSSPLVLMDGTRNIFCLPITATASGRAEVIGTFQPSGGPPLTAVAALELAPSRE
jgi:hypothetical protein